MYDRLQLQRFELKYLISEEQAAAVREFVRPYLVLDEYGAYSPDLSYEIHSLYCDSDELTTYWWTINGDKNRFKLRIRFYDDSADSPAFLEIKRRMNEAILKKRAPIRKMAVAQIFDGQIPPPEALVSEEPRYWLALQEFCRYVWALNAKPKGHVAYRREAWVTKDDNSIRVTMDRLVRFEPRLSVDFSTEMKEPVYPFRPWVILEIKFTGRFPAWIGEMVHAIGLLRCAASKYCDGVAMIGEEYFYTAAKLRPVLPPEARLSARRRLRQAGRLVASEIGGN